jgi:hypothetical protein
MLPKDYFGYPLRTPRVYISDVVLRNALSPITMKITKPAKAPISKTVRCSGAAAGKGRSDVGPRFQNLPITVATEIDAHKARKPGPEISQTSDLVLAWALASTRSHWLSIASRLTKMSAVLVTSDPGFSDDLGTLSEIARYRAIRG